jgi:hypothetical protein
VFLESGREMGNGRISEKLRNFGNTEAFFI